MNSEVFFLGLFFLVVGYFFYRKGVPARRWIFISILATLFIMVGVFGSDLIVQNMTWYEGNEDTINGIVLLGVGLIGLGILVTLREKRTQEIGYSFGIGGAVQVIIGSIKLISGKTVFLKFGASLFGVIIVSYLMYRYRDFIMKEME